MNLFDFDYEPTAQTPTPKVESLPFVPKKRKVKAVVRYPDIGDTGDWLFTDGGLLSPNPSAVGGTWAWVLVRDGEEIRHESGVVFPADFDGALVKSPFVELHAMCLGILALPTDWSGTVACDYSGAIGWVFRQFNAFNVPRSIRAAMPQVVKRAASLSYLQLAGHPKPSDLEAGKRLSKEPNYPVSVFNVRCDDLCNAAKASYFAGLSVGDTGGVISGSDPG